MYPLKNLLNNSTKKGNNIMGTDIHPVVQIRKDNQWQDVKHPVDDLPWNEQDKDLSFCGLHNRNYQLFAILADVRNGHGFAGIVTGEPVKPISMPKGYPEDFIVDDDYHNKTWMGYHSQTWLTLAELLAFDWKQTKVFTGVISLEQFKEWDGLSAPESYSGAISGPKIVTISEQDARELNIPRNKEVYVQITWRNTLADRCSTFIKHTIPWLQSLGSPNDVRLVIGFDS